MPADLNEPLPRSLYQLTKEDKARFKDEAALGMIAPSARLLSQVARPVDTNNLEGIAQVIEDLRAAASGQRGSRGSKNSRTLVGLAAPQVGVSLRIILVDTHITAERKNYGELRCFINPEIVWRSRETAEGKEGCFSAGAVWGIVRRPIAVKIRALTPEGKQVEQVFENFTARIIQHEIDHLDGIRFPDRIKSDRKRHWVHTEELPLYTLRYHHWPRTCSKEQWQAVKEGIL